MKRPLGAQISHMLKDRGVDVIFGIPGVHNQEMYRGIEEAGITHVLARHEQGAGFMADGYARATGKPGVCYVITGPGLCNIMTPMGQAYSDSVPMLVISSCLDEVAARKGQLHQMKDQRAAADTVCEWSHEARTAEAAYQLVDRFYSELDTNRHRPKHIQVPISVLEARADTPHQMKHHPTGIEASDAQVAPVAQLLSKATRPLFIFGGGARGGKFDAAETGIPGWVEGFLKTGAASFTTYAGRGIIPADAPLHCGATLARPESAGVIGSADLVIAVGTGLDEVDMWRPHLGHTATLVRIDIDPSVVSDPQKAEVQIVADASFQMEAILESAVQGLSTQWSQQEVAKFRAKARADVDAEYPGVLPIADALRACLPQDTMVYSDMTQFAYASNEVWDMHRPGHWHHPSGFGTLGYALPAAIGGAVARKNLPTLAIVGDYGFHYTMAELGVAVELGLPIPIILWDNGKLGAIEASMVGAQIAPNAVIARNPDFCKLAEAFGAVAVAPADLAGMQAAVQAAFKADGPTLIYVTPDIVT